MDISFIIYQSRGTEICRKYGKYRKYITYNRLHEHSHFSGNTIYRRFNHSFVIVRFLFLLVRDVNVLFILKNDRFIIKRRQKIKNETIVFKNDRYFTSSFFRMVVFITIVLKNDRFWNLSFLKTIVFIKLVVSLTTTLR